MSKNWVKGFVGEDGKLHFVFIVDHGEESAWMWKCDDMDGYTWNGPRVALEYAKARHKKGGKHLSHNEREAICEKYRHVELDGERDERGVFDKPFNFIRV